MSDHEPFRTIEGIPLQAHVEELRRRCEATADLQGGATSYWQEVRLFRTYLDERGLGCDRAQIPELSRAPDDEGNEHQVWFQPETDTYLKITWPDFFGMLVLHRPDEEEQASPIAYLERWHLHNELFGDNVSFHGTVQEGGKLRLVIQQQAIAGEPATLEQINDFFTGNGWKRFTVGCEVAYFDPERNMVISDTHRGNIIMMKDGLLAPIDLRVQALSGAMLDYVIKACRG